MQAARDLLSQTKVLFAAQAHNLPNPLVYINAHKHARLDELHDILPLYMAGEERQQDVVLGRYQEPVFLDTRQLFLAAAGDTLIAEQLPYHVHNRPQDVAAATATLQRGKPHAATIDAPVLLVGRYGYEVWGHWLNEMLPKAVAVEAAFPGRFSYAVPAEITIPAQARGYCAAVLESLAAYGIGEERLLRLPPGGVFQLNDAYDVAGCWQYGLHPEVARLMRAIVADVPATGARLMVMRHDADMRAIYNTADIAALLAQEGFQAMNPRMLNFRQQAEAFARAGTVAGELGSNLSGLIFSPDKVRLLSFAPYGWLDAYFLYVMKQRRGFQADIRGATTDLRGADKQRSPFVIDPVDVRAGLAALTAATPAGAPFQAGGQEHPREVGGAVLHLRFGQGGSGLRYLRGAWHAPEPTHSWCQQTGAIIEVPAARLPAAEYWLEIRGISVSYKDYMPARPLSVSVNEVPLVQTHVTGNARVMMRLPAQALQGRKTHVIEITHPALGPAESLGAAGDQRTLGIGLAELVFHG